MNLDDLFGSPAPGGQHEAPICSRRACTAPAVWALAWNNPKIHAPDRRKVWTACQEHRDVLADFLSARGFLRETTALSPRSLADGP